MGEDLDAWLIDEEGWYWIRTEVSLEGTAEGLLFDGTQLGWTAWWNGTQIGASGSLPPVWGPSSPIPSIADISGTAGLSGELLMRVYLRKGFTAVPPLPVTGTMPELQIKLVYRSLIEYGIPLFVFLTGILLFFGSLFVAISRRDSWNMCMSMFGFFLAFSSIDNVLSIIPNISAVIPWSIPALVVQGTTPFAVSFWRRSVSAAGKKDPAVISVIDYVLAACVSVWGVAQLFSLTKLPTFAYAVLEFNPMPLYLGWSALVGLILWLAKTKDRYPNRSGPLLIWLTAIVIPAVYFILGADLVELPKIFIDLGLALSVAAAIPAAISVTKSLADITGIPNVPDIPQHEIKNRLDEEPEELEPLEETGNKHIVMKTDELRLASIRKEKDLMLSLRSGLYPEAIPWDGNWDLASARQGSTHPSTGFHDVYTAQDGNLSGFSFMDAGSSELESLLFAHIARSEMLRAYQPESPLSRIARRVHRKTAAAAGAAGKTMNGVIGRFHSNSVAFVPLSMPPLLLKRSLSGKIVTLQPFESQAANPSLGSRSFGERGLKTVNIAMAGGDILAAYTPALIETESPAGQVWGIKGLAEALKRSTGVKAEEIVADIIGSLKDFIGQETLDFPLQILVIRKR